MEYTTVDVDHVAARTDKAILINCGGMEYWIPLSCISEDDAVADGGPMDIAAWLVQREGLPEFEGRRAEAARSERVQRQTSNPGIADVMSAAFGRGRLLREEGDKSVVRFADGKTRTLGTRYVLKC